MEKARALSSWTSSYSLLNSCSVVPPSLLHWISSGKSHQFVFTMQRLWCLKGTVHTLKFLFLSENAFLFLTSDRWFTKIRILGWQILLYYFEDLILFLLVPNITEKKFVITQFVVPFRVIFFLWFLLALGICRSVVSSCHCWEFVSLYPFQCLLLFFKLKTCVFLLLWKILVINWMFMSPSHPKFLCWNPTPNVRVFGRWLVHEGGLVPL